MNLRKAAATALLGATIAMFGNCDTASAKDVWFHSTYKKDFYVRTETIKKSPYEMKWDTICVYPNGKYVVYHDKFKYAVRTWNYYADSNTLRPVSSSPYYTKMFAAIREYL